LENYKIALTIDPGDQEAANRRARVETLLEATAKDHYARGLVLHKEGKYGEARRQFLTALRLRPDYREALEMLTARKRVFIERYIVHEIKPGESLSKLAMIYYGDYRKFPVIAKYNNLSDATRVYVGQEIKVPEIEGVVFMVPEERLATKEEKPASEAFSDWAALEGLLEETVQQGGQQGEQEAVDPVANYREHGIEFFEKEKYRDAILEFNKVLSVYPDDSVTKEYTYRAYYQIALALFEKKDYLAAREQFMASLRYKKDCQDCHAYIKQSEALYKEMHYKLGIQYYGKEQLVEAIKEWELVKELDPNYKSVEDYINRANSILRKLQELRKE
ncbi:MAG: tetratricopeptide repeat protein, partial [Proteobacteria bacterium]|nr:tetratricopeptide repeat protein [Pseudomonadota bacterium]